MTVSSQPVLFLFFILIYCLSIYKLQSSTKYIIKWIKTCKCLLQIKIRLLKQSWKKLLSCIVSYFLIVLLLLQHGFYSWSTRENYWGLLQRVFSCWISFFLSHNQQLQSSEGIDPFCWYLRCGWVLVDVMHSCCRCGLRDCCLLQTV